MKNRLRLTILGLLAGLFLFAVGAVSAQTREVTDDEVNAVAKDLFCPVCESTPLDVCPTQACADWRELIRTQLAAGKTEAEVYDYFARQYGDGVLANPPKRGFNLILWGLPVIGVFIAGVLFVQFMRRLRQQGKRVWEAAPDAARSPQADPVPSAPMASVPPTPQPAPAVAARDYISRVEEELLAKK